MAQTQAGSAEAVTTQDYQALSTTVSRGRLVSILIGVMLGMLLASLDQTIVGTALPRIVAELGGLDHYAWVVTAYLLASTITVPIYGKLSDIYGRRLFFIGGMVIFLAILTAGFVLPKFVNCRKHIIDYRGAVTLVAGTVPLLLAFSWAGTQYD